jgi:hypothetical protein
VSASVSTLPRFDPRGAASTAPAPPPRLRRHPLFASRDEAQVRGFLAGKDFSVEFPIEARHSLDARINGVYLPGGYLGHLSYGSALVLTATPQRTDYWFEFATNGRFHVDVAHRRFGCDARTGAVLSPGRENVVRLEARTARLAVAISRDAVVRQLSALLGRAVTAPLHFEPSIPLDRGYGRGLARYVQAAVDDLEDGEPLLCGAPTLASFEQFVITALLVAHPHDHSAELRRPEKRPAPRNVRRAVDYIEANLTAPVTLEDIVRAAGVSGRVLLPPFSPATGV